MFRYDGILFWNLKNSLQSMSKSSLSRELFYLGKCIGFSHKHFNDTSNILSR
eukprot:UN09231